MKEEWHEETPEGVMDRIERENGPIPWVLLILAVVMLAIVKFLV